MLEKRIIFLLHLVALLLYRIYGYSGHFGFDDIEYAQLAFELSQGNFIADNHFSYRLAIIIPTAISYFFFGVSDWSSSLSSILASTFILFFVYQFVKKENLLTVSLALSFTLFTEWFLFYGNKLMVDIYVGLAFTAVVYVFYHLLFIKTKSIKFYAFALAASLFFGFNCKGTIILILPLLLFFLAVDIKFKRHFKFWQQSILFSALFLLAYFLLSKLFTAEYFSRFYAIGDNSYLNKCSYANQPLKIQLFRIARDFWEMLRVDGFALVSLIAVAPLIAKKGLKRFNLNDSNSFFISTSFILLISSNFMTISPFQYNPMCLDFRHYLYLVPIFAVTASFIIGNWDNFKKVDWLVIIGLSLIVLTYFFETDEYLYRLYLPALIILLLFTILKRINYLKSSNFLFLLIPLLIVQPIFMVFSSQKAKYDEQWELVNENLLELKGNKIILTDQVQRNIGRYWNGFNDQENAFMSFEEYGEGNQKVDYLLLNPYTQFYAGKYQSDLPLTIQYLAKNGKEIFLSNSPQIQILDLGDISIDEMKKTVLFQTENKFNGPLDGWSYNSDALIEQDNNIYEKVWEYSATYKYQLDSVEIDTTLQLRLKVEVDTKFLESTEAIIVATVSAKDSTLFWTAKEVNTYQRAYGNWWPVETAFKIPMTKEMKGAKLAVFLWNTDKKDARIDNFKIKAVQF